MKNPKEVLVLSVYKFGQPDIHVTLNDLTSAKGKNLFDGAYKIKTRYATKKNKTKNLFDFGDDIAEYYIGDIIDKNTALNYNIIKKAHPITNEFKYVKSNSGLIYEIEDWEAVLSNEELHNLKIADLFDSMRYYTAT